MVWIKTGHALGLSYSRSLITAEFDELDQGLIEMPPFIDRILRSNIEQVVPQDDVLSSLKVNC